MTRLLLTLFTGLVSVSAFASGKAYTCSPYLGNSYFADEVALVAVSETTITVNDQKLKLDKTYKPRNQTKYKRYTGETELATGWQDSGLVEVFWNKEDSRLAFQVRGEIFIREAFYCKQL